MHTVGSKISARERELAPRYYYKIAQSRTCLEKIKDAIRMVITFMFTQVGVVVLVATYMVLGAFLFVSLEADSLMELAVEAREVRENFTLHLWAVTLECNPALEPELWRERVTLLVGGFQQGVVQSVEAGYTGAEPGERLWTFASALMFSLTIITTIGYGNLTPKTPLGKIATMLYALLGIPVMCLYMANIGGILASSFKYLYSKLCRCEDDPSDLPKKATLPSIKEDTRSYLEEEEEEAGSQSSQRASREASLSGRPGGRLRNIVQFSPRRSAGEELPPYTEAGEEPGPARLLGKLTGKSAQKKKEEKEDMVEFKLVEDLRLVTIPVTTCMLVLLCYIVFGAILFSAWEGWNHIDGAYFCFTSLMTIGFGDLVPGNSYIYNVAEDVTAQEANARLVLCAVYLLLGLGIISMCFNLMQEKIISQVRLLARSLGLVREWRDIDEEPLP